MEKVKLPELLSPDNIMSCVRKELGDGQNPTNEEHGCVVARMRVVLERFEPGRAAYLFEIDMIGDKVDEAAERCREAAKEKTFQHAYSNILQFDVAMAGWPSGKDVERKTRQAVELCVDFYRRNVVEGMMGERNAALEAAEERIENVRVIEGLAKAAMGEAGRKADKGAGFEDRKKQTEDRVTQEEIDALMASAEYTVTKAYGKATVVTAKFPNGWTMTEQSACVDPANYDHNLGVELCKKRIEDKLWELEGYRRQCMGGERHGK